MAPTYEVQVGKVARLSNADRATACRLADDVTGRSPGTTSYFLGKRDAVFVAGRGGRHGVRIRRVVA